MQTLLCASWNRLTGKLTRPSLDPLYSQAESCNTILHVLVRGYCLNFFWSLWRAKGRTSALPEEMPSEPLAVLHTDNDLPE